jgi:hypothetical protein
MAGVWALVFGFVHYGLGNEGKAGLVTGLAVLSHWVLDYVTHRPDLLLYPKAHTYYGLGMWNSVRTTLAVEGSMFGVAVLVYFFTTRARDWIGQVFFWVFVLFLAATYVGSIFGPPPPSLTVLLGSAFGAFLLLPWAAWFDRHRRPLSQKPTDED